jgi:hypothetical protein
VAFRFFVTDVLDAEAARFYEQFGLASLAGDFSC